MIDRGIRRAVLVLVVAAASVAGTFSALRSARADEDACIAATEAELTLRKSGKLHDALVQLAICTDTSCSAIIRTECGKRVAEISSVMPTLIFAAQDGAGNDLAAVTVTMDGKPLASSLDGRAIAVDPGPHAFHFETSGAPPLDKSLVLREGERDRRELVILGAKPAPVPVVAAPAQASRADAASTPSMWTTQRKLALVSAGVGVVGLGLGAIFGGLAIADKSDETNSCSSTACSNRPQAREDYDVAGKNATVSTIGFVAGGVFLAGGAVLWLTAPKAASTTGTSGVRLAPMVGGAKGSTAGLLFSGDL